MFEKLGIDVGSIIFYAISLVVLVVALYLLLYKPVTKMIQAHRAKLDEVFEENKRLNEEAEKIKEQNEKEMERVRIESMRIAEEAATKASAVSDELLAEAEKKAKAILETARNDAQVERKRLETEFRDTVGQLAVEISEKILQREVLHTDNEKLIDESLSEWEN